VFPNYISSFAKDILTRLLRKNPDVRLGNGPTGTDDIKKHSFFRKINWKQLSLKEMEPPIIPLISDMEDVSNFDECFTGMPVVDSPCDANGFPIPNTRK
jgi:serine/threonine protein kinase